MRNYNAIVGEVLTDSTSNTFNPIFWRDQYGAIMVSHSGNRLAAADTHRIMLQGSLDGTAWFTIETMAPGDEDYQRQPSGAPVNNARCSWTRVVQLMPFMRVQVRNGASLTYTAIVVE